MVEYFNNVAFKVCCLLHNSLVFLRQVILNPKLEKKSNKTALFFEGCVSTMDIMYEHGLDCYGEPIKVTVSGWQARILQNECDHLEGTLYVHKMVPKTFRTVESLTLPLGNSCSNRNLSD
ncbi:Peptide deformylase 1A, chloroplastic/mitochondrial [Stylosanthes scabra]|uniref:Peptide deformylase n=1 Tax=Stylosanthes scabra TaxID=79078 RepID=A0ABU6X6X4_9FABA|nr:Peptide deformylase 1A, chloroplastic/mitochondrial [Stylosanthes scabra]